MDSKQDQQNSLGLSIEQELITGLRTIETHMSYLKEKVDDLDPMREALQKLQLDGVTSAAELKNLRDLVEDVSRKMNGPDGGSPLPARIQMINTSITSMIEKLENSNVDVNEVKKTLTELKAEVSKNSLEITQMKGTAKELKTSIEKASKDEIELKKEKLKSRVTIVLAIITLLSTLATLYFK